MSGGDELEHVRDVLSRHRDTLMALPGVTGTGIGASVDGQGYAIVVYMEAPTIELPGPEDIEGVTVQYKVTGAIRPQKLIAKPEN